MKLNKFTISAALFILAQGFCATAQNSYINKLDFNTPDDVKEFFRYKGDGSIIMSGHRGGHAEGFSENCIEGLDNVLRHNPAMFEIDPRLTRDSVVVLMHDATLERTTNGTGKVSDYTFAELRKLRLKDHNGNLTDCRIPTLDEVIEWSRGKTIINLDKKDVPMHMIADIIRRHNAEKHVMLTVHTGAQARYYYDRFPDIMLSVFSRNAREYEDLCISGVPFKNMIAYVGYTINEKNEWIVRALREKGIRCMISLAPTWDKLATPEERAAKYAEEIAKHPDIIESDIPTEVWDVYAK